MRGKFMADVTHQEPEGDVTDASTFDTEQLGFMCGIEVHQQLATGKLHSRQPSELFDVTIDTVPGEWPRYARKLRLASGEAVKSMLQLVLRSDEIVPLCTFSRLIRG